MSLLAYPFHVLAAIIRFIFQSLRVPLPNIPISFSSFSFTSVFSAIRPPLIDPYTEADRWVRSLEEETGTLCISRGSTFHSASTGKEAEGEAGPSGNGMRSRYGAVGGSQGLNKTLPDFWVGGYEDALRAAQQQLRVCCIILVSAEHDDVLPFKREALSNPSLVDLITKEEFVLWGGDVRGRDAWSASQKLGATTFPFVAFAALQPPRGVQTTSRSSAPVMTILSRHQGASATTAATLRDHINNNLLPRVKPFLQRLQAQEREREFERQMREEQDRRFEESARRDREKAEMIEMEEVTRRSKEEEEERRRVERKARDTRIAEAKASWRGTTRQTHIPSDMAKGTIRMGVRLPDGRRITGAFSPEDTVFSLYCLIDQHIHPTPVERQSDQPSIDLDELLAKLGLSADEWWGFTVSQSYPRRTVVFHLTKTIGEDGVEGSLSVEFVSQPAEDAGGQENDDGYHTEDE